VLTEWTQRWHGSSMIFLKYMRAMCWSNLVSGRVTHLRRGLCGVFEGRCREHIEEGRGGRAHRLHAQAQARARAQGGMSACRMGEMQHAWHGCAGAVRLHTWAFGGPPTCGAHSLHARGSRQPGLSPAAARRARYTRPRFCSNSNRPWATRARSGCHEGSKAQQGKGTVGVHTAPWGPPTAAG
jgi:hypothetical protein